MKRDCTTRLWDIAGAHGHEVGRLPARAPVCDRQVRTRAGQAVTGQKRGLSKAGAQKYAREPGMTSREAVSWPQREDSLSPGSCPGMPLESPTLL